MFRFRFSCRALYKPNGFTGIVQHVPDDLELFLANVNIINHGDDHSNIDGPRCDEFAWLNDSPYALVEAGLDFEDIVDVNVVSAHVVDRVGYHFLSEFSTRLRFTFKRLHLVR